MPASAGRRPIFIRGVSRFSVGAPGRTTTLAQVGHPFTVLGADDDGLAPAEGRNSSACSKSPPSALLTTSCTGTSAPQRRDLLVRRREPVPDVHQEQHHVRAPQRHVHLGLDVRAEVVAIDDAEPPVSILDPSLSLGDHEPGGDRDPVAGHPAVGSTIATRLADG